MQRVSSLFVSDARTGLLREAQYLLDMAESTWITLPWQPAIRYLMCQRSAITTGEPIAS
jgi:hypothetical protein